MHRPQEHVTADGPDPQKLKLAQVESFVRQTPVNAFVTICVAASAAAALWGYAPTGWLLVWLSCQSVLSIWLLARWWTRRGQHVPQEVVGKLLARAKFFALVSGSLWGAGTAFFPSLPLPQLLIVCFMMGGIAAGASTTLAAIPQAAALYQASCILPAAIYLALRGEAIYTVVAALALVLVVAMLGATQVVYSSFLDAVAARGQAALLMARLESARSEWLEISESASGFALFDERDELLLWNENYGRILSLPPDSLFRGVRSEDLDRQAAREKSRSVDDDDSVWPGGVEPSGAGPSPEIVQLDNGRFVRSDSRRTESGHRVVIHEDVTELTHVMSELHRSRQKELLGQLSGGVAHDFNNLLTVIIGNLDLLRSLLDEPKHQRLTDTAMAAANRGARLVERLLVFARKQPLSPRAVDVNEHVLEIRSLLEQTLGPTIDLQMKLAAGAWRALADPTQLANAIINLSLNAKDAMPSGGTLRFETANIACDPQERPRAREADCAAGFYVRLTVTDDGEGMVHDVRKRAVEPFFTTRETGKGSGLGLSMVYGFAKASRGHLEIDSAPGRFTSVALYLPRAEDGDRAETHDAPEGVRDAGPSARV